MADNEERLLQELTEKQTLLARMQLQLATLEKLVSDNTLRISTGNFPSSSSTSSAVDSYEDFDPAAAETAGDELAMLEYLEQLEQQRRDVVQLLNSTARKSQQSDSYSYTASEQRSNVRVRNETRQFGTTQSKAAPSYNGYAVGSCSGENDDGGNNSRVKLLDLHSSVQEHIEARAINVTTKPVKYFTYV
jgi:hypothetical protein